MDKILSSIPFLGPKSKTATESATATPGKPATKAGEIPAAQRKNSEISTSSSHSVEPRLTPEALTKMDSGAAPGLNSADVAATNANWKDETTPKSSSSVASALKTIIEAPAEELSKVAKNLEPLISASELEEAASSARKSSPRSGGRRVSTAPATRRFVQLKKASGRPARFFKPEPELSASQPQHDSFSSRLKATGERLKTGSQDAIQSLQQGAQKAYQAMKATGNKLAVKSQAQWKKTQIGTMKLNGQLACEIGCNPLALAPKSVKNNEKIQKMLPEYKGLTQEAHVSTKGYRVKQAKTLGMAIARTLPTASVLTLFSTAVGSLIAYLAQKKVEGHHPEQEVQATELPDLDASQANFDELKASDPELAARLDGLFSWYGNESQDGAALKEQFIEQFKEGYNAIPPEEREAYLDAFASSTQETALELLSNVDNIMTDTSHDYLNPNASQKVMEKALESANEAAKAYVEAPAFSDEQATEQGTRAGAAYGALFGGISGLGFLAFAALKEQRSLKKGEAGDKIKPAWYEKMGKAFGKPDSLKGGVTLNAKLRDEAISARSESKAKKKAASQYFENQVLPVCNEVLHG